MPNERQLSVQADRLSRLTRELSRCCQGKEEQIFGAFDLSTAEGRVLLSVADCPAPCTPSALAERLNLGRSRLTPLVENLVHKGFLSRAEHTADRRVRELTLTAQGAQIAGQVTDYQISFHENLLRRFATDERLELLAVLDNLHKAIEEQRETLRM
jgi:DNA-binding MarR family transcriptional regulator